MASDLWRRFILRAAAAWQQLLSLLGLRGAPTDLPAYLDLHAVITFRAMVDAVVPETPALGEERGPEHVPGGLAIDLDEFAATYVNGLFQLGLPHVGPHGNLPLAIPVAKFLDVAALKLLTRNENESPLRRDRPGSLLEPGDPSPTVVEAVAGPFAQLSREDRLRAIAVLDELELEVSTDGELLEIDGGLMGQLVVGFTEMIYYSEWQGYDEYARPPSERFHPNDPAVVQSWRQTGYPGFASGYAALRGYLGTDDGPLGDGEPWAAIDEDAISPVRIVREPGQFQENDYDTSGYEEPYPEVA